MDANKFMAEYRRLCISYKHCMDCPLYNERPCSEMPLRFTEEFSSKLIKAVEDWSAAHPVTTRADAFKKLFPNISTDRFGSPDICPVHIDKTLPCPVNKNCDECRRKYWGKEVQP